MLIGIDIGTSSAKATAVDSDGNVVAHASAGYPLDVSADGTRVEQAPEHYLGALQQLIDVLRTEHRIGPADIEAVGLAGQTPTLVLTDERFTPVRPALSWMDMRAIVEASTLEQSQGDPRELFGTNLPWSASNTPAKLVWLLAHEADIVRATRWALQPKDYVGARLTGSPASDAWSSKGLCDASTGLPSGFLGSIGWPEETVPPILPPWRSRGEVSRSAAALFGLAQGTPVAVGASDALAGMLALGAFSQSTSFILTGTSDIIGHTVIGDEVAGAPSSDVFTVPASALPTAGRLSFGPTQAGAASLQWVAGITGMEPVDAVAAAGRAGSRVGPVFVPYLSGERAPIWRPQARGVFLGLGAADGPAQLVRAVLLGVACADRHVLETALGSEDPGDDVALGGGWAQSVKWARLRSAVLGRPVRIPGERETTGVGAAVLGGAAAGQDLDDLVRAVRHGDTLLVADDVEIAFAQEFYQQYRDASEIALRWSDRNDRGSS